MDRYSSGKTKRALNLAKIYLEGEIEGDYSDEVIRWLEDATRTSHGEAESILGYLHEIGHLVPKDQDMAISYYRQGWEKKAPFAGYRLARQLYEASPGTDNEKIVQMLNIAAHENSERHVFGSRLAEQDEVLGRTYGRLIADLLGPIAFELAVDYVQGRGVAKDLEKAASFYASAAGTGIQEAHLALAYMFRFGQGVAKDETEEKFRFYKAAACLTFPEVMERPEPFRYDEELCKQAALEHDRTIERGQSTARNGNGGDAIWTLVGLVGLAFIAAANGGGDVDQHYEPVEPDMSIDLDVGHAWMTMR